MKILVLKLILLKKNNIKENCKNLVKIALTINAELLLSLN